MVEFWVYDVIFLVLFCIGTFIFLRTRRSDLSREGWMFLYRTKAGIRAINYVGDNFKRTLSFLKIPIAFVGSVLMASMIWMLYQTLSLYIKNPQITDVIKAPPVAPLIPYFPKLFGMQSFFPPFYFTYFLVALAIVAVVHEFSHGIFMRRFGVKIKSTGLVFLGPILGAFVEEDPENFKKKKNFEQMVVLGAGVFANVIFALIFYFLYAGFFLTFFSASGYIYDSYSVLSVPTSSINFVGEDIGPHEILVSGGYANVNLTKVSIGGKSYLLSSNLKDQLNNSGNVLVFEDAPAINSGLKGIIVGANEQEIRNQEELRLFLEKTNPGDKVIFTTLVGENKENYEVVLGEHPNEDISYGYLGVGHSGQNPRGVIQGALSYFMSFKESSTYYVSRIHSNFSYFVLHLLWWVMIINLLVALFNMLPLGILDGGRFFYLGVLSITGSEKFAGFLYKVATYMIALAFVLMMFFWAVRII